MDHSVSIGTGRQGGIIGFVGGRRWGRQRGSWGERQRMNRKGQAAEMLKIQQEKTSMETNREQRVDFLSFGVNHQKVELKSFQHLTLSYIFSCFVFTVSEKERRTEKEKSVNNDQLNLGKVTKGEILHFVLF